MSAHSRSGAISNEDRIYFARRAAEEQDRAATCQDPNAAKAHRKMQRAYLERASTGNRSDLPAEPTA